MTEQWTELMIGVVLLISPWILGFSDITLAKWCNVLFGLILILINVWPIFGPMLMPMEEVSEKTTSKNKK